MMQGILEEATGLELQHINVKLLLATVEQLDLDAVVNIFHSWIQDQPFDQLLLDVADYRHVHHGPGIVLIGHEADYSIDNTDGRLGLRYNRKAPVEGSNRDRVAQAFRAALAAAQRLQQDAHLNGRYNFKGQDIEIIVNDRLRASNSAEMRRGAELEFRSFLNDLLGEGDYSLEFESEPRKLLSARITSRRAIAVRDLLENLNRLRTTTHEPL